MNGPPTPSGILKPFPQVKTLTINKTWTRNFKGNQANPDTNETQLQVQPSK